ncbi:MAG: hypothetical protein ABI782_02985, partial [Anaerolineaceae bacterium]
LGAAAGGLGGLLVGGVVGRLAMFILRLTSDDSVRGIESDDGFTIGRFDLVSTLNLLAVTAVLGAIVGLIVVAGRPFFPKRGMPFAWALAGAITGGAILVHEDGVDFSALEPHLLAVAFFIAIPAVGAGLIAWLTEVYPRFWWRKRKLTVVASVVGVPLLVFFPIALFAILVGGIWFLAMQWPRARSAPAWRPARVAAISVFAFIVALGLLNLTSDIRAIV